MLTFSSEACSQFTIAEQTEMVENSREPETGNVDSDATLTSEVHVVMTPTRKKRRRTCATPSSEQRERLKHAKNCPVHQSFDANAPVKCYGVLQRHRKQNCNNTVAVYTESHLPMCRSHKSQTMTMSRCRAHLACGFPCDKIIVWKEHDYPLCKDHRHQGKCYLLTLPAELQEMIYQYLLPESLVPHQNKPRKTGSGFVNRCSKSLAILRVCKTIHETTIGLLYDLSTFEIGITTSHRDSEEKAPAISMCYSMNKVKATESGPNRHALQDYQMQLMLLEQANALRVLQAGRHGMAPTVVHDRRNQYQKLPIPNYEFQTWEPPLAMKYFQRIRKFHIHVTFHNASDFITRLGKNLEAVEIARTLVCESIHQLVQCLNDKCKSLQSIKIDIRFIATTLKNIDDETANSEAMKYCLALLKPFTYLTLRCQSQLNLWRLNNECDETIPIPLHLDKGATEQLLPFTRRRQRLGDFNFDYIDTKILEQYRQLTRMVNQMMHHPHGPVAPSNEMEVFLREGRLARERGSYEDMADVCTRVKARLFDYNETHQVFMAEMKESFGMSL